MRSLTTSFFLALLAASAYGLSKLEGVWQTVEVKNEKGAHAGTVSKAPGLLILTGNGHYSMNVRLTDGRPELADTTKATAPELLKLWGPFIANAGTYEVSGDTLDNETDGCQQSWCCNAPRYHSRFFQGEWRHSHHHALQSSGRKIVWIPNAFQAFGVELGLQLL